MVARFYLKVYKHSCIRMASTGIVFAVSGSLLHNRLRLFTHSLVRYSVLVVLDTLCDSI